MLFPRVITFTLTRCKVYITYWPKCVLGNVLPIMNPTYQR